MYIDEKFKDATPESTVAKIKSILDGIGIEVTEKWNDSGVDNCFSLNLSAKGGFPFSNGKGITKEFARASAYGEFIERLQGGLFFYKYQSSVRNRDMKPQSFAPDAKYMTVAELEQDGEWMDYIVDTYNHPSITRKTIAKYCKIFACADDDKILTLPFYSIFEKKHVYLPIDFVDQIYATNGCCVGNTREEAWVHALSEIMERHANILMLTKGNSAPKFPKETLDKFPVVSKILEQIRNSGDFDIDVFDYSFGSHFPIVSTRIIDKKTHGYRVNVAADPVLEIALQRSLTELMQGKNLKNITTSHNGKILNKVSDIPVVANITNQLETGSGLYTVDYFANEITCNDAPDDFTDNSNKNNRQLLNQILEILKKENKQVYVRNFSYLGFSCYRFVIPGYSEALILKLCEPVPEFSIADIASKVYKNPKAASNIDLTMLLNHSKMIRPIISRYNSFNFLSGIPIKGKISQFLVNITRAYACYRLGQYDEAIKYSNIAVNCAEDPEIADYILCANKYIEFTKAGISKDKITSVIGKFFTKNVVDKLLCNLENGKTPYDELLICCEYNCENCKYRQYCKFENVKEINNKVGAIYNKFTDGQNEKEFCIVD